MVRVGLKKLVMSELITDIGAGMSEDNIPKVVYGAIKPMPNVQSLELNANVQEVNVDSDDGTDIISSCTGYSGSVVRNAFSPEDQAWLLGEKTVDGMNVSTGADDAPYVAFGFKSLLQGEGAENTYLYMWVLKAKFSQSNLSAQSKGNETLTPQADSLSFKSSARECDGAWRFYMRSSEAKADATFFTQKTLQTLADASVQSYAQPVQSVEFVESLPASGDVGVIYIAGDKAHYWNGASFVEIAG